MIANEHLGRGTTQFDTWNLTARAATQIGTAAVTLCVLTIIILINVRLLKSRTNYIIIYIYRYCNVAFQFNATESDSVTEIKCIVIS